MGQRLFVFPATLPLFLILGFLPIPLRGGEEAAGPKEGTAAQDQISRKALEDLVATLEDPDRRSRLVNDLRSLLLARQKGEKGAPAERATVLGGLTGFFNRLSGRIRQTANQLVEQLTRVPGQIRSALDRLGDPKVLKELTEEATIFGGVLIASVLASILAWLIFRRTRAAITRRGSPPRSAFFRRLGRALALFFFDLMPPLFITAVALVGISLTGMSPTARLLLLALIWALALKWASTALVELILEPRDPGSRLVPLGDERAASLAGSLGFILSIGIYGHFLLVALLAAGLDPLLVQPLRSIYGLILLLAGIALVLRERGRSQIPPAEAPASAGPEKEEKQPGRWRSLLFSALSLWWIIAIFYMIGLYLAWASGVKGGFIFLLRATAITALAVLGASLLYSLRRKVLLYLQKKLEPLSTRHPELRSRLPLYDRGLKMVIDVVIIVLAICFSLEGWGVSALGVFESEAVQSLLAAAVHILGILLLSAALIDGAVVFARRYLESREKSGKATNKMRTLIPLIRTLIRVTVITLATIMILSELGVQVGPLLAGVGILGLAVGFGAQTLVKDIITGFFILLEDTVSVGDVAVVDGTGGLVEGITIRTLKLRDLAGNVHTIPYSSAGKITNMTKEYSRYVIDAGVAYRENVDEVIQVLKEIDEELRSDPEYAGDIIEPIEILGLDRFADSAVVVRARLTTRPIKQWRVGREFNRRMKKAFDERGIEIPFPHQTVYFGELKDGTAPPLRIQGKEGKTETAG